MPQWLEITLALIGGVGGLSGVGGLVGAFVGLGKLLEQVKAMAAQTAAIPDLIRDVSYIRGRLDGRQEGLEEITTTRRRRPALAAHNGG